MGFTSGTGGAFGNHDILSWEYRDSFDPIIDPPPSSTVPESSTVSGLLLLGILGTFSRLKRTQK